MISDHFLDKLNGNRNYVNWWWAPLEAAVSWTKLTFAEKIKLISQLNLCNQKAEKIQKAFSKDKLCCDILQLLFMSICRHLICTVSFAAYFPVPRNTLHLNSLKRLGFFTFYTSDFLCGVYFLPWNHLAIHLKYLYDYFTLDRKNRCDRCCWDIIPGVLDQ